MHTSQEVSATNRRAGPSRPGKGVSVQRGLRVVLGWAVEGKYKYWFQRRGDIDIGEELGRLMRPVEMGMRSKSGTKVVVVVEWKFEGRILQSQYLWWKEGLGKGIANSCPEDSFDCHTTVVDLEVYRY